MEQILVITLQNLKSIPGRLGTSLVAVVGVAGVVAVLVAVLSMARGFENTLESGTSPGNVIVLRSGSSSELDSGFQGDQARIIAQAEQWSTRLSAARWPSQRPALARRPVERIIPLTRSRF